MSKVYFYRALGYDQYKVMRVDESLPMGKKGRYKEYLIDLKDGNTLCSCEGFYYKKKSCKHIKFLLSQLADKGGIVSFEREGDVDRLMKETYHGSLC